DGLLFDFAAGNDRLDAADDNIAKAGRAALAAAEHLEAHHFLGAGVVGHRQPRLHLNHGNSPLDRFIAWRNSREFRGQSPSGGILMNSATGRTPLRQVFSGAKTVSSSEWRIRAAALIPAMSTARLFVTMRTNSQRLSRERGGH